MTTSKITVTMLGMTGSGKSTYMLGMYIKMSQGLQNYFLRTEDPDDDLDLDDAWSLLHKTGELPPPTVAEANKQYSFLLNQGSEELVEIDWLDYRGGALKDKGDAAPDARLLRDRLEASDSVYLTLDGGHVAEWLSEDGHVRDLAARSMEIRRMSVLVGHAEAQRKARGLPAPSLVLLITKADLIRDRHGPLGPALAQIVKSLEELVPVACRPGITALLCPVQLGTFGAGAKDHVDPAAVAPFGLHRPLVFSLMHYLSEGIQAHQNELYRVQGEKDAAAAEVNQLRGGFLRGFFNKPRIVALDEIARESDETFTRRSRELARDEDRIGQLAAEIAGIPIVRDGQVVL